eukprot:TRINITY_DN21003_c0_g1_i1.p1 TRINITY_DN21003_c0_g1~~TRINITY_DN21003_c0_g1_i1.p1  ORF type:complete len:322 (+),score=64.11 TRINITY_DN21003_c0_g1_i1:52-1017(+)
MGVVEVLDDIKASDAKACAFHSVAYNKPEELQVILAAWPVEQWVAWRNKAGKSLMGMSYERGVDEVRLVLVQALARCPEAASSEKNMTRIQRVLLVACNCSALGMKVQRFDQLRAALAEVPVEVWTTWCDKSGVGLMSFACDSSGGCKFRDVGSCQRDWMVRSDARAILQSLILAARSEWCKSAAKDNSSQQQQLSMDVPWRYEQLHDDTRKILTMSLQPGSLVKDLASAIAAETCLEDGHFIQLYCRGMALDMHYDEVPIAWYMAWQDFDGFCAKICQPISTEIREEMTLPLCLQAASDWPPVEFTFIRGVPVIPSPRQP